MYILYTYVHNICWIYPVVQKDTTQTGWIGYHPIHTYVSYVLQVTTQPITAASPAPIGPGSSGDG